ncbi:9052_t:CDS:2 [Funneliformis mosseae]|uniref:9052_t:CDS:1 n=1 Tax=Funneliformis mosseae TaxID=27381 RepID=A0A9N9GCF5_FUNMO|nr:9052_t:CDS:2 [Funneliformis mosseae]
MTYLTQAQPIKSNEFIPINEENNDDNLINQSISNEEMNSDSEENLDEPFGYEEDNLQPKILQIHTTEQEKIPEDDLTIINSIMKNIKLPDSAIPEWAKSIPEEAWLPITKSNDT